VAGGSNLLPSNRQSRFQIMVLYHRPGRELRRGLAETISLWPVAPGPAPGFEEDCERSLPASVAVVRPGIGRNSLIFQWDKILSHWKIGQLEWTVLATTASLSPVIISCSRQK